MSTPSQTITSSAVANPAVEAVETSSTEETFVEPNPETFASREIDLRVESKAQAEGRGARVRRSIGNYALRNFDPFLMLDEFYVTPGGGFPDHPHRGFETVTYMLEGKFQHEDFAGHAGEIGPGDLQWMTAGRGIVHSEMPASDFSHGLQLWVNLSKKDKLCEPRYQELLSKNVPKKKYNGVHATIIAGSAFGITSPVYTLTPANYLHFKMDPNSNLYQPIPKGWSAFLYTLEGNGYVGNKKDGESGKKLEAHYTITLSPEGDGVHVRTEGESFNFVLIAGQPLKEPIQQYGPFVMNSREEIMDAMRDYQGYKNGFERAESWSSKIAEGKF